MGILNTLRRVVTPEEQDNQARLLRLLPDNSQTALDTRPGDDAPVLPSRLPDLPAMPDRSVALQSTTPEEWHPPMAAPAGDVQTTPIARSLPQIAPSGDVAFINLPAPFRSVAPQPVGEAPTMVQLNNKGRPLRAIGGDQMAANETLLNKQENYQAPRSTKDQILAFLTGGLPGGLAYAVDQKTRNQWATGRDIAQTEGTIQRDLGQSKERAQIENMGIVPVEISDGRGGTRIVMVPRGRQGATVEGDVRNVLSAQRISARGSKERKAQITAEYKAGMLRTPEQLQDAADELEIPGNLQPAFIRGEMKQNLDPRGNYILTNQQTGATTPVIAPNGQPQGSFARTQETGRNNRSAAQIAAANQRSANMIAAIRSNKTREFQAIASRMGDPDELNGSADALAQESVGDEQQANQIVVKTQADLDKQKALRASARQLKTRAGELRLKAQQADSARKGAGASTPSSSTSTEDPLIRDYADKHFNGDYKKALEYARKTGYSQ